MAHVDCTVKDCMYNADTCCCRMGITVKGECACKADDTNCGNYEAKKEGGCKNAVGEPSKNINITCDVCECRYFDNNSCTAGNVDIISSSGSNGKTQCASFEAK